MKQQTKTFEDEILEGIPSELPSSKPLDPTRNHAPKRKAILNDEEQKLALRNALRYFDKKLHPDLIIEFKNELKEYGRIYMYRFRPSPNMLGKGLKCIVNDKTCSII